MRYLLCFHAAAVCCAGLLGACGQTGALYLPDEGVTTPVEIRTAPTTPPAAPTTPPAAPTAPPAAPALPGDAPPDQDTKQDATPPAPQD
jgi:predicted small lipoprotein YifL